MPLCSRGDSIKPHFHRSGTFHSEVQAFRLPENCARDTIRRCQNNVPESMMTKQQWLPLPNSCQGIIKEEMKEQPSNPSTTGKTMPSTSTQEPSITLIWYATSHARKTPNSSRILLLFWRLSLQMISECRPRRQYSKSSLG